MPTSASNVAAVKSLELFGSADFMKLKIVLTAIFTLIVSVAAVSAQNKAADYSGKWNLDVSRSKLDERSRIESMTMTVSQTGKELTIESSVKRAERQDGGGGEMRRGGMGAMRRGGGFGGDGTTVYTLDGKETVNDLSGAMGGKTALQAKADKDGNLTLLQTRNVETQMGAITLKTTETWSLSADGKILTVKREAETPRGTNSSEMVFTKQ